MSSRIISQAVIDRALGRKPKLSEADIQRACTVKPGARFGRLLVLGRSLRSDGKNVFWDCICDCRRTTEVTSTRLRSGHTSSCGCWRDESRTQRAKARRSAYKRERRIWYGMIKRCEDPKVFAFKWYGERGIRVCKRWFKFENFLLDMGPSKGRQIERRDNNRGYAADNCEWADSLTQANNRSSSLKILFNGEAQTASVWSRRTGINPWTLRARWHRGLRDGELFSSLNLDGSGRPVQWLKPE